MSRKLLVIIAAVAVVAGGGIAWALGAFGSSGAAGVMPSYQTVPEALALPMGQAARVGGDVVPGSVGWNNASGTLDFTLTGGGRDLRVSYPGLAPNDFKPGTKVLVEGTPSNSGLFLASSLETAASPLCRACHG